MKLFRKTQKPAGAYRCPICGHAYRHAGMAERCTWTPVCRGYNVPSPRIREMWRIVGGAASLGWFFAHPILDTEQDEKIQAAARQAITATEGVFASLHKLFPCSGHVRKEIHDRLMAEVAALWKPGGRWHMGYVGDVVQTVLWDVLVAIRDRDIPAEIVSGIERLCTEVEALYSLFIGEDDSYEDDTLQGIFSLSGAILGPQPEERKPSLYLVNDRHLVVGRGRAEVRKAMMKFGLSRPSISGISNGERFADGRTAADIIKSAARVPSIVGRMEA